MQYKKRTSILSCLLGLLSLFALSCKKERIIEVGTAQVRLVNTYQNSNPQDFYQEDIKLNAEALAYGEYSDYANVATAYSVFWTNDATTNQATSAIDAILYNEYQYTFFYYVNADAKTSIAGYINEQKTPAAGKFRVRFLNLCAAFDGQPLRIVNQDNTLINSELKFGDNPVYTELPVNTQIKVNIKNNTQITTLNAAEFEAGKTYLVWFDTYGGGDVQYHVVPQ
jgi:hypothetical protein